MQDASIDRTLSEEEIFQKKAVLVRFLSDKRDKSLNFDF